MKKYYLNNGIDYSGPFSKEELREKKINKKTLVWSEDWADWKKAGEVDELKLTLLTIPPTFKTKEATPKKSLKRKILKYAALVASLKYNLSNR
ncbi:MAG: DUF4339 domain-containing protein [Flavobacteriaceae bacterium]|nr:DUF4339 domain-containing protein [Flavobacteriaceae bacterium]